MKRLRRIAAVLVALLLGLGAWLTVLMCYPTRDELRLARQLSTGSLIAHVPEPRAMFFGRIAFGHPLLGGRILQTDTGSSVPIQPGVVWMERPRDGERIWHILLHPLDKAWEIELVE